MRLLKSAISLAIAIIALTVSASQPRPMRGVVDGAYNFWFYEPDTNRVSKTVKPPLSLENKTESTSRDSIGAAHHLPEAHKAAHKAAQHSALLTGVNTSLLSGPDSIDTKMKPLVIFLHGASLCGNDLNKVRRYGTIDAIECGRDIDAYVIAPQNPGGAWNPKKINKIVKWVEENYANMDTTRIYVLGMSLGGYGTLDYAAAYPGQTAAAMAFCGGSTAKNLGDLNQVPLWIIHGTADRAVSVKESDRVVEAMKQADPKTPRLIYDRFEGMNHSTPARYFYLPSTYEWLFSHSTTDRDRPVSERFDIKHQALSAYKGLNVSKRNYRVAKNKKSTSRKRSKSRKNKKS